MTALAIIKKAEILESLAAGKRLSDIGNIIGIRPQSISQALHDDPDYRRAIEQGYVAKLDRAEQMIEDSADQTDVSRARALWGAISWRAGVEVPARWGAKQTATLNVNVVSVAELLADRASAALGKLIEHEQVADQVIPTDER